MLQLEVPTLEVLNLGVALPAISVAAWACIMLLIDLRVPSDRKEITAWLSAGGLVFAFVANLLVYNSSSEAFLGVYIADQFTGFMNIIILITGFLSILLSIDYVKRAGIERGEYYTLMLFTVSGMMFMAGSNDLVAIFVSLELLSIPLYVLAAARAPELKSEEAGLKYFILGAFSSAFFVFGLALIYGATGTTNLPAIFAAVETISAGPTGPLLFLLGGTALLLVGLGFKVAAVPFHMWTPDVYEGSPTPVTAFMSVAAKAGGFAGLLRLLIVALPALVIVESETAATWQTIVALLAAATLIVGNYVAISQTNMKRMLAYSSIAHAGYILMAAAAAATAGLGDRAAQAALLYLFAYMFTNIGAFAVAIAVEKDDGSGTEIRDFIGLAKTQPLMAFMMAVFMLSLTGIPLTAGFVGKWFVFDVTLQAGLAPLAILGVITSVVSAFYYVRVIVNMYLVDGEGDPAPGATSYVQWATYLSFAGTILIGVVPILVTGLTDSVVLVASLLP